MEKLPRPAQLEAMIREIIQELLEITVTPHVRELRAKAVTYGRVINNWSVYLPSAPQVQAMHECVTELREKVVAAKREVSRVTRRPSTDAMKKVNPPYSSIPSPGLAWNANVADTSVVRARKSSSPAGAPPSARPPGTSVAPLGSVPPVSAQRPIESPTPVPALLRSRRSR